MDNKIIAFYPITYFDLGGDFFDLYEYSLYLDIPFIIFTYGQKSLIKVIKNLISTKYEVKHNKIIFYTKSVFLKNFLHNYNILTSLSNFLNFNRFVNMLHYKNIYAFLTGDFDFTYRYQNLLNRAEKVTILTKKSIFFDFDFYQIKKLYYIDYFPKIWFKIFKKKDCYFKQNNCALINAFLSFKKFDSEQLSLSNYDKVYILSRDKKIVSNKYYIIPPVEDLFGLFGTYIYIQPKRKFDVSPRFITESKFFNKKICFLHDQTVKDGAYYRYNIPLEEQILKSNDSIKEIVGGKL